MKNTILITGASNGIGKELAIVAAENQNNVILVARNESALNELANLISSQYNVQAIYIVADLGAPGAPKRLYNETKRIGYQIHYLINNAGIGVYGKFMDKEPEKYRPMIDLNITALTELTHFFVADMIKAKKGGVLNVASTASFQPDPYLAVYGATKAYVASFTEALSWELKGTGVTATVLSPGSTTTGFFEVAEMTESKLTKSGMSAREVAKVGYRAMMKGKLHVVPGLKNKLLAFASAVNPPSRFRLALAAYLLGKDNS